LRDPVHRIVNDAGDAARRINPALESISVSATTGEGLEQWYDWLAGQISEKK